MFPFDPEFSFNLPTPKEEWPTQGRKPLLVSEQDAHNEGYRTGDFA